MLVVRVFARAFPFGERPAAVWTGDTEKRKNFLQEFQKTLAKNKVM